MSNLSLRERDAATIAQIGKRRFSPLSVIGGQGNRLIEEGGRSLLDLSGSAGPAVLAGRAVARDHMPPLTLSEDEVAEHVAIIDQAIADVSVGKVSDADVASFMMW